MLPCPEIPKIDSVVNGDKAQESSPPKLSDSQLIPSLGHRLAYLRLRRIVKENHGTTIRCIGFNRTMGLENANMLGVVGGWQFSVYDNEHCGSNLDLVCNFANFDRLVPEKEQKEVYACVRSSQYLTCFAWMKFALHDTHIAVGGEDGKILLMNLNWRRVERVLSGHVGSILQLATHRGHPNLLFSLSRDGSLRVWDVSDGSCCATIEGCQAQRMAFHSCGNRFLTSTVGSGILEWKLDVSASSPQSAQSSSSSSSPAKPLGLSRSNTRLVCPNRLNVRCCDLMYVGDNILIYWSSGEIGLWDPNSLQPIRSFSFHTHASHSPSNWPTLDVTACARFMCAPNPTGDVYVWEVDSGRAVGVYRHQLSRSKVTSCRFTRNGNIICGTDNGSILRWDYAPLPQTGKRKRVNADSTQIVPNNNLLHNNSGTLDSYFQR
eukprot:85846_1